MGWSIGYDRNWLRWIGYGVPAWCDHPKCDAEINRGLSYVCGGMPYGGERGCGLYFCASHLNIDNRCPRCAAYRATPYARPKTEHPRWLEHMLRHPSWREWRKEHPEQVRDMRVALALIAARYPNVKVGA